VLQNPHSKAYLESFGCRVSESPNSLPQWQKMLEDLEAGEGADMAVSTVESFRQFSESQLDIVLQYLEACEGRKHQRIPVGRVIKLAILSKVAMTHEKRKHYRSKLRQLFL